MSRGANCCFAFSFLCCLCCSVGGAAIKMADLSKAWIEALTVYKDKEDDAKATRVFLAAMDVFEKAANRCCQHMKRLQEELDVQIEKRNEDVYSSILWKMQSLRMQWRTPTSAMSTMLCKLKRGNTDFGCDYVTPEEVQIVLAAIPMFYPATLDMSIVISIDRMLLQKCYDAFKTLKV